MPKHLKLRELSADEEARVRRLASSRTEPARLVQRARVIRAMLDEPGLSAAAAGRRAGDDNGDSGRLWVKRFNEAGVDGLVDEPRAGRPVRHTPAVREALIRFALQKPRMLGEPYELWTLERLQRAFKQREGIHLSDSTIWEWLEGAGLHWKQQQSWFHEPEHRDPAFAEKRGP